MAYEAEKRVVLSHQQAVKAVRERVAQVATERWRKLGSYRDDDIERFVSQIVPLVESGQKTVSQLTSSYLDSLARIAGKPPPPKVPPKVDLRGIEMAEVYRRPAITAYTALSEGKSLSEAVELGAQRLDQLVNMDMQLANVRTSFEKLSGDGNVVGYQRVLAPGENCALCAIASTQRYHTADLMPIHDNCSCDVLPIYGDEDPGQVINAERLQGVEDVLNQAGVEYTAGGFKSDRSIRVNVHGEHGPVLTWADQKFTSAKDIGVPEGAWVSSSGRVYKPYTPSP